MKRFSPLAVEVLGWLTLCAALGGFLGIQSDWGRRMYHAVPSPAGTRSAFTPPALTEPYPIRPAEQFVEFDARPLFLPTRRPPPVADTTKPTLQRDQFVLVGTALTPEANIAFLLEKASGKVRPVPVGTTINGLTLQEVSAHRAILAQDGEQEILPLKVAVGPQPQGTPAPAAKAAPAGAAPAPASARPAAAAAGRADGAPPAPPAEAGRPAQSALSPTAPDGRAYTPRELRDQALRLRRPLTPEERALLNRPAPASTPAPTPNPQQ